MKHVTSLAESGRTLSAVAMGTEKADTVLKNCRLVNVNTLEIQENIDVAISCGRVALIGDASHCIGDKTEVIDLTGMYISPGFMDGHIHVESSFLTVSQYAKSVVPHGTSAIFMDPHEIANVLGMKGVKLMVDEARDLPLRVYTTMPSCVPAAPGLEDTGAVFSPEDIEKAMADDDFIALGEMMNYPGVVNSDPGVHRALAATLKQNKCITGHYSIPISDKMLDAYIAPGIRSCHESVRAEDALEKMRRGMYVKIREGSAWHDLKEVIRVITEFKAPTRFATLVSDDSHPQTLITTGHLDHIVRRAIEEGLSPVEAISMVSLNVAECFFINRDYGSIAPGKVADINVISDLEKVKIEKVFLGGTLVAENGELIEDVPSVTYPDWASSSVHLKSPVKPEDLAVKKDGSSAQVNIIQIEEAKVGTSLITETLAVNGGAVQPDASRDIAKVAVIERHKGTGTRGIGFVRGFKLSKGAVASTYAHDAHNLMVLGTNDSDMAFAANELAKVGGGFIAVESGKVLSLLPLPLAGLMTDRPAHEVAEDIQKLEKSWNDLGCDLISPFMTMSLLGLAVIPDVRITNKGLFDVLQFKFIDLIKE